MLQKENHTEKDFFYILEEMMVQEKKIVGSCVQWKNMQKCHCFTAQA